LRRPVFGQRQKSLKIQVLRVSINVNLLIYDDKFSSSVRKLFALIACCHQMLGDLAAALKACSEDLRHDPDAAELLFR
jgi:hypothetical protein